MRITIELLQAHGRVTPLVVEDRRALLIDQRRIVGLSENVSKLTHLAELKLHNNLMCFVPIGVLCLTQLTLLGMGSNALMSLPPQIGQLVNLLHLYLNHNVLQQLPREIGNCTQLLCLSLTGNKLTSLPRELGACVNLHNLWLRQNELTWLPRSLERLSTDLDLQVNGNRLAFAVAPPNAADTSRHKLTEIFAATTALAMMREEALQLCVGLQELDLPALVTLEIVDAAFENDVRMFAKWELIVAVKHHNRNKKNQQKL